MFLEVASILFVASGCTCDVFAVRLFSTWTIRFLAQGVVPSVRFDTGGTVHLLGRS